jgi:hypothetical protein
LTPVGSTLELPLTAELALPSLVPPIPVSLGPIPSLLPVLLLPTPAAFVAFALAFAGELTLSAVQPAKNVKRASVTSVA